MSEHMKKYFEDMAQSLKRAYDAASSARSKGLDPEDHVEIELAKNLAERVEGLIGTVAPQIKGSGVVERIGELEKKYGAQDWRVALEISLEIAKEKFCKFKDKREAMEVGIRVGVAYATVGVVSSPLEGFVELNIRKRKDGKEYFALMYSGPIRSAGGTAAAFSVIIADHIRVNMGYDAYDPTPEEIKRMSTEIYDYHERVTNVQYLPSPEEIEFLVERIPVQIDGDPSEVVEVSNYTNLARIAANKVRNGPCLVLAEGVAQKAVKLNKNLSKFAKDFNLKHWDFLEKFIELQKKIKAKGKTSEKSLVEPDYTFIKDIVAGRPVLTYPMASGGFRLRYGRGRNTGFSSDALHPATMAVLNNFIAVGTQLKVERPGKSTVIATCDQIEGPVVKLKNGKVLFLETEEEAKKCVPDIEEIIYLGDIMINYGDFLDRGHRLMPPGYCEEWWKLEAGHDKKNVDVDEAIRLCNEKKVPLHPRYTFHWKDISKPQFNHLIEWLKTGSIKNEKIVVPYTYDVSLEILDTDPKRTLELLGVPHDVATNEYIVIEGDWAKALLFTLGTNLDKYEENDKSVLETVSGLSGVKIRDKSGTFIGARMGRPEKAKMRKMAGSPQILFPVGEEGGRLRSFQFALEKGYVNSDFPIRYCSSCEEETIYRTCERCHVKTKQRYYHRKSGDVADEKLSEDAVRYKPQKIDIHQHFNKALEMLGTRDYPALIKGVKGTSNEDHEPEHLAKGILRAKNLLYVNKDGTIRYDMTEMTLTNFKPKEIGTSVQKLRELGYNTDVYGNALVDDYQILELKPQDVILPANLESLEEGSDEVLFRVANFIDDLLEKMYGLKRYYNLNSKKDLVGHLVIGMSPHTSAGILGRIIGFSRVQGLLAHPYFHSIMRRDCDGDEACVILLMDGLLNFSRHFLPAHRGGKQDEPLVLTSALIPSEVDNMVFNLDICTEYPLELYQAAEQYKFPWEVKVKIVNDIVNTDKEFEGFMFTHDTTDINHGAVCSSYKSIPTMEEKVKGQMELAEKIRAVDEVDVARLVIERHFIRDIKGNMRKFSQQEFRCVGCNEKFRRPPLMGKCTACGGKIIFTISEGSIVKYLEPSLALAEKYDFNTYLRQILQITKTRIESVFGKTEDKQEGLVKWFG